MALIDSDVVINPDSASKPTRDIARLSYDSLNLAMHVLTRDSDTDNTSDQTNNNSGSGWGTAVAAGSRLVLQNGAQVSGGTLKVLGDAGKDSDGGVLLLDNASLSLGRLAMAGGIGDEALDFTNNEADTDVYPTLELTNGSSLFMTGADGNSYRAFFGNHNIGRLKVYDSSISFGTEERSDLAGVGAVRPNMFLGTNSRFNNAYILEPLVVEFSGSIKEFENVTIKYGTENSIGGTGLLYFANDDVMATLGGHTIELEQSIANTYTNAGWVPYAGFRADALRYTINGQVDIKFNDGTTIYPACHLFYFQGGTHGGLNNNVTFNSKLNTTVNLFDTDNSLRPWNASGDVKYGLMDNRDFLIIDKDAGGFSNGRLSDTEYTYYHLEKHALCNFGRDERVILGWPTGKAAAAPGFKDGSSRIPGLDNAARYAFLANNYYVGTDDSQEFPTDSERFNAPREHLTNDLRRFYPMRSGYYQWGYYPEYEHEGLGTDFFLGIDGAADYNIGNLKSAEASSDAIRNGTNIVVNSAEDAVTTGTTLATARALPFTATDPTGPNGRLVLKQGSTTTSTLDDLYRFGMAWVHDHMNDTEATFTAQALTEASRDDGGFSPAFTTAVSSLPARSVAFFSEEEVAASTVSEAAGTAWSEISNVVMGGNTQFLRFSTGSSAAAAHQWTDGYIYFMHDANNWGFYRFTRNDNEQVPASNDNDIAHLTFIHGVGSIQNSNINIQRATLRDSLQVSETYPVRSYLWNPDVALRPFKSDLVGVKNLEVSHATIEQSDVAGGYLRKGTMLDTVVLQDNDAIFNANDEPIDVNIAGNGIINNFLATTVATNPSIRAGNKVVGQITVQRGQDYIVAGDASEATFVLGGTGNEQATVSVTGNGQLPRNAPDGIRFRRAVTITFRAPTTAQAWDTDFIDSELWVNIAAVATPEGQAQLHIPNSHEPFDTVPGAALGRNNIAFSPAGNGWRTTTASSPTAEPGNDTSEVTIPTSWASMLENNGGIAVQMNNATEPTTLNTAVQAAGTRVQVAMYHDSDNWAVFNLEGGSTTHAGNRFLATATSLYESVGQPMDNMAVYFNIDTDGNVVSIYNESVVQTGRTVNGRDLTYTFELASHQELRWAFSARAGQRGNWYYPVQNAMVSNVNAQTVELTEIPSSFVPLAFSSGEGIAAQHTYFESNPVVGLLIDQVADTDARSMQVTIGSDATTGTVGDGQYITRLMQQKTNYLFNVARGNYIPIELTYNLGFVGYDGFAQWVTWQKAASNNNRVAFDTPTVRQGQSANLEITTDNVTTEVRFEGAVNIGILNATQAELLEDTAKRSDVYAANVAL